MKKIIFLLSVLLLGFQGFSQITIDQGDMPSVGDTLRMSFADSLLVDYTKTGNDTTWDFSMLKKSSQTIDTFMNVTNVPAVYWLVFTPGIVANLASPVAAAIPLPGVAIDHLFAFYKKSSSAFNNLGLAFQISGIPIMVKYGNPDIFYTLPMTMGTTWNSVAASSASLPGIGYYATSRNRTSHVDGWGHLITPYGNYQVLRVKSHYIEHDSIYLDTLSQGFPVTRDVTEYKWLAKNQGEPLLSITEESGSKVIMYRDIINHAGIFEKRYASLSVFPNPAFGPFKIRIPKLHSMVQLVIFNSHGARVINEIIHFTSGESELLNYRELTPGEYLLQVSDGKGVWVGKLVKW